jgi:hypothetical protein
MSRKLSAPIVASALGGLGIAVALFFTVPGALPYAPLALLLPVGMVLASWRQSADESRVRSAYENYAFREIVRMKRKRVEGW